MYCHCVVCLCEKIWHFQTLAVLILMAEEVSGNRTAFGPHCCVQAQMRFLQLLITLFITLETHNNFSGYNLKNCTHWIWESIPATKTRISKRIALEPPFFVKCHSIVFHSKALNVTSSSRAAASLAMSPTANGRKPVNPSNQSHLSMCQCI